ncbi:MAG: NAD(P)H-binding protein, partial [Propionibacterium sp.]|nr:NAD(P)H-binding protein [Propionibacterium sp.]
MIMVTGARGQLASLTLDELARSGVETVAGTRHPSKGERLVDFDDPATLDFSGISTLVLVSAGYAEDDIVVARHRAAIEAAERDGVKHVIYTSLTGAGDHLAFALAHRATEKILQASALEWTILRNGLYAELFGSLLTWTPAGLVSPFANGAIAVAARPDLAIAAARVAASPKSHVGRVYEL